MPNELLPPIEPLSGHRSISQIFAYFAGNRGVVGNTTFAFWAAMLGSIAIGSVFSICGYPLYGLIGIAIILAAYFGFLGMTWHGVGKYPDASVTGEGDYVRLVLGRVRHAAKNPKIIDDEKPTIGGSTTATLLGGSSNGRP